MKLSQILNETAVTYYHGSRVDLPAGTILTPRDGEYEDEWGEYTWYQALEYYRPAEYLPHRFAVFMTDNIEDIDNAGGSTEYVFTVKPIGKIQKHDMNWMSDISGLLPDEYVDYIDDEIEELALNYWHGIPHNNESVWEYLVSSAEILHSDRF